MPILALLAFGLEAGGLLDLSELIASSPFLAMGGGILSSLWAGTSAAAWLSREPTASQQPGCGADLYLAIDDPDHMFELPTCEPGRKFRDRVSASRSLAEEIRCRGDC